MSDLSAFVAPKSDQLNYDDFIGGKTLDITITSVKTKAGEQPASIHFEGDNGKPWKPCKSMIRILIALWGSEGRTYGGRRLRLYGDPEVKFGGDKVGGIRISHASGLQQKIVIPLTVTRGKKAGYLVQPLPDAPAAGKPATTEQSIDVPALKKTGAEKATIGLPQLKEWWSTLGGTVQKAIGGAEYLEELKAIADKAESAKTATGELPQAENSATTSTPAV